MCVYISSVCMNTHTSKYPAQVSVQYMLFISPGHYEDL